MQDQKAIKDGRAKAALTASTALRRYLMVSAIELKGCLDGNNTDIFERPTHVQEFVMWSVGRFRAGRQRHRPLRSVPGQPYLRHAVGPTYVTAA